MNAEAAPRRLTLLLALAALLLIGSGAVYYAMRSKAQPGAPAMPVEALYEAALDAGAAAAGEPQALARFQQSQKTLEDAAARDANAPFATDARFSRLMSNATAVLRARAALTDAAAAARDTAILVPRLAAEARALEASLPPAAAGTAAGTLERFDARAQRLQFDVSALLQGSSDPAQAAQRIAESSEYLGQVIAGFAGGSSTLALPRVTTPESAKHLKTLDSTYSELAAAVKRAVAAAPALPAAQNAARAITADAPRRARNRCTRLAMAAARAARCRAGAGARGTRGGAAGTWHARAPACFGRDPAPRERSQPAGHTAAAR
jgi:hypothetical protein